jgi:hypothetical protein
MAPGAAGGEPELFFENSPPDGREITGGASDAGTLEPQADPLQLDARRQGGESRATQGKNGGRGLARAEP